MSVLADSFDEAGRVLAEAERRKVTLRLIGGLAVKFRCPSARSEQLKRKYLDIDFMGLAKQSKEIKSLFGDLGYEPRSRFNAMMGAKRLIFNDLKNDRRADIFLDVFEMCHKFDFRDRLKLDSSTLPLADLLATKLQIVQANEKDYRDMVSLFLDHDVDSSDGENINGTYLADMCSKDWGVYKTFVVNLSKIPTFIDSFGLTPEASSRSKAGVAKLNSMIEAKPKSLGWKMRARVGERMPWYELPEDDKLVVSE
ncbi:MAG TPA: hypothetical protein VEJ36_01185 [Nitrososphaerales archaeon]|nr:hypothetical protein [Nitrososphaerales archaeon]